MTPLSVWSLFPFPTVQEGGIRSRGSIVDWPKPCIACSLRPCENANSPLGDVQTCKFGVQFVRASETTLIAGITVSDIGTSGKNAKKMLRRAGRAAIRKSDLDSTIMSVARIDRKIESEFERVQEVRLKEMLANGSATKEVLGGIKTEVSESLERSHDFLQFVTQIRSIVTTILEQRFPGKAPEVAAEELPMEGAIFYSTELMQGKVDATLFLKEPNKMLGSERIFEVHRMVNKYFKIYRWQSQQKEIDLRISGECHARVRYNDKAFGVVIHSLLDNVVKYAPAGSKADIIFREEENKVSLSFESLGPKIQDSELDQIFLPGYRSLAAKARDVPGLGFGLGAAKMVSDMIDLRLRVEQETTEAPSYRGSYVTRFTIALDVIHPS